MLPDLMTRLLGLLLAYALGAAALSGLVAVGTWPQTERDLALADHGHRVTGSISHEPDHKGRVSYQFGANGFTYYGRAEAMGLDHTAPGDPITITYDPNAPWNNCACDPRATVTEDEQMVVFGGLWLGLMLPISYWRFRSLWLRPRGHPPHAPQAPSPGTAPDEISVQAHGQD